jgi:hypothetical protein
MPSEIGISKNHFWTPITMEASAQMRELEALLTQLQLSTHENDKVDLEF